MTDPYVVEDFTAPEREILLRYFTNTDLPVFALKNLPEIVKGALFARYSRTGKSLRRLFLDEFYKGDDDFAALTEIGARKAAELYDRIFIEFGDDSVAQLGGAHIAVEQGSNILTKQLEWGRLAAYLEQSTRYVAYDDKPGGRWRYFREPDILRSRHGEAYVETMDRIFELYAAALPRAIAGFEPLAAGSIRLGDALLSGPRAHLAPERRRVGMMFQEYDPGESARYVAWHAARGDGVEHGDLRNRASVRADAPSHARVPTGRMPRGCGHDARGTEQDHPRFPPARGAAEPRGAVGRVPARDARPR